jgi:hypothetical protein
MWQKTQADLEKGIAAHKARKAAMKADFKNTASRVAVDLGCDQVCFNSCIDHTDAHTIPACLRRCHCGQGMVDIQQTQVNTVAIIEKEYGDVENLSEQDMDTIEESLNLM